MNFESSRVLDNADENTTAAMDLAFKFGAASAINAVGISEKDITKIAHADSDIKALSDNNLSKKFAFEIAKFLASYGESNNTSRKLFKKIASSSLEEWNGFYEDCVKLAAELITKFAYPAAAVSVGTRAVQGIGSLGSGAIDTGTKLVGLGIPAIGAGAGAGAWMLERGINEDSTEAEKIRAKIVQYKILAARLDREINARFADKDALQPELANYKVLN